MKPLISVIVPVYNAFTHIDNCVTSLLKQSYKNLEIILIDDGSTDGSGALCDKYAALDKRIKVIHKQNGGVSAARNTGLDNANGDYIGFTDIDDWAQTDMYEYLLGLCQKHKTEVAVCGFFGQKPVFKEDGVFSNRQWLAKTNATPAVWCKLFSKKAVGNIRFRQGITMNEDGLFSTEVIALIPFVAYGTQPKYHYEDNTDGATKKPFNSKKLTFFKAVELEQQCVAQYPWPEVHKKYKLTEVAGALRLLKQVIYSNYKDQKDINCLISVLKKHFWVYLSGNARISVKIFMVLCCINFKTAAALYGFLYKR